MTVFRPFDIHRTTIVLLNLHRLFRQFLHFFVGERENVALFLRHIFNLHLLTVLLGGGVNHADFSTPWCGVRWPDGLPPGLVYGHKIHPG